MRASLCLLTLAVAASDPKFGLTTAGPADSGTPAVTRPPPRPPSEAECSAKRRPPDRACTDDADCTLVHVKVSCCGTEAIFGISRADLARFQAQERQCPTARGYCKCAPGPTQLDDGSRLRRGGQQVAVGCREERCTSFAMSPRLPR